MRVRVIQSFIDKTNGQVRNLNEVFECTELRFEEIEKAGHYVDKVADEPGLDPERKPKEYGNETANI